MKRANLIFLGIGVVVVLLLFLTLIPVREGAKLTTKTTMLMDKTNADGIPVIPTTTTTTTTTTPAATKTKTVQSSVNQTTTNSLLLNRSIITKRIK
jgi:hypothetical protein